MSTGAARPSVCLAISSFRNDESVVRLVESALEVEKVRFSEVLIVDSLGTGALPAAIEARGWRGRVVYFDHDENLGSAGNLSRRLELAAARGHDWVYAVNHDGEVDPNVVDALLRCGEALERPGAVYPLRFKVGRGRYDLTGRQSLPLPFRGTRRRPDEETIDVYWGSSNGTLYATAPIRAGIAPWPDLWMAWEDFGFGWALHKHGYRQVIVTAAQTRDGYEYVSHRPMGYTVTVIDKPAWYAYYQTRNLFLITRRNRQPWTHWATVGGRVLLEAALTTAFRPDKVARYRLLARGTLDGLLDRAGKWTLPRAPVREPVDRPGD